MSTCHVCDARADANLCRACTRVLEQAIAELPADLRDLQLVATRQAAGPLGLGVRRSGVQWDGPFEDEALGDAPWEFAPGAADQLWAAANTITTWVRHLCESRKVKPPAPLGTMRTERRLRIERNRAAWINVPYFAAAANQPLNPIITWLLHHLDTIRYDEAARQIFDELTGLHDENALWSLGRSAAEVFAGQCDAAQVSFELDDDHTLRPIAATCGSALYGREDETEVRCSACGTRYPLAARLAEMQRRQIDDQLARAHVIADALTTLERPLGRDRLRKWIQRDALRTAAQEGPACVECKHATCRSIRRPPIHARGKDDEGHWLYRVGDVRRRLALTAATAGQIAS